MDGRGFLSRIFLQSPEWLARPVPSRSPGPCDNARVRRHGVFPVRQAQRGWRLRWCPFGRAWFSLAFTCHPFTVGGKEGRTLWEARGAVWTLQRVPGV